MKKFILLGLSLMTILSSVAQSARVFRSEFLTYDTREDATADKRSQTARHTVFKPTLFAEGGGQKRYLQNLEIDGTMNDYNLFLHLENIGAAYTLLVNNEVVAEVEDTVTPADFMISSYLHQGLNEVVIGLRESRTPHLQEGVKPLNVKQFDNSYFFAQRRLSVRDYSVVLEPDSTRQFARLQKR